MASDARDGARGQRAPRPARQRGFGGESDADGRQESVGRGRGGRISDGGGRHRRMCKCVCVCVRERENTIVLTSLVTPGIVRMCKTAGVCSSSHTSARRSTLLIAT